MLTAARQIALVHLDRFPGRTDALVVGTIFFRQVARVELEIVFADEAFRAALVVGGEGLVAGDIDRLGVLEEDALGQMIEQRPAFGGAHVLGGLQALPPELFAAQQAIEQQGSDQNKRESLEDGNVLDQGDVAHECRDQLVGDQYPQTGEDHVGPHHAPRGRAPARCTPALLRSLSACWLALDHTNPLASCNLSYRTV